MVEVRGIITYVLRQADAEGEDGASSAAASASARIADNDV